MEERKLILKKKIWIACALFFMQFSWITFADAQTTTPNENDLLWGGRQEEVQVITGLGARDPVLILAGLIRVVLGFLGILALTIVILAGFKWMLSGGNEERAADARRMLFGGIIGLLIILASFALANYVISILANVVGTTSLF